MQSNTYTVAVSRTFTNDIQRLASSTGGVWREYDAHSWQATPSRPAPIDPETIEAHFQRVLARFKRVEERRAFRSTSRGCWYSPTAPSLWSAETAAAPTESRALWLLNNCQLSHQIELRMIEAARIREEVDVPPCGWNVPTATAQYQCQHQSQSINWPSPPPPPRPYSPSTTPWSEPSPFESMSHTAATETERRAEGIPIRVSRTARRRMDQPRSSYAPVPEAASMDACLQTSYGPTQSQSYPWGAPTMSTHAIHGENTVAMATPTGVSFPPVSSRVDWCPEWPSTLDIPNNATWQFGGEERVRTTFHHTATASDGGATCGGRSPVSRGPHTPEEIMPWAERRVDFGCGTWVIRGPSDVGNRPRPAPPAVSAPSYHHGAGSMRHEEGPPPAWDYVQQEDEQTRLRRKAAAFRQVLMDNGLWEILERR